MKKTGLLIIAILLSYFGLAQDDSYSISTTRSGSTITVSGTTTLNGITSSSTTSFNYKDIFGGIKKKSSGSDGGGHERNDPTPPLVGNYEGPSSEGSWGRNGSFSNSLYEQKTGLLGWEKEVAQREAMDCLKEMKRLLDEDCMSFQQLQNAFEKYKNLSDSQISYLGPERHIVLEKMREQLEKTRPLYDEYSLVSQNIKNNLFSAVDKEIMHQPYESLNEYLKQFLTKEEFDKAKIEFEKREKDETAKEVLEKVRRLEMQEKSKKSRETNYHPVLQKVRHKKNFEVITSNNKYFNDDVMNALPSIIPESKVAEKILKAASDKENQLSIMIGEEFVPKSEVLDKVNKGFKTVNKANRIKEMLVKSYSGDWEGTKSDYNGFVKENVFHPTVDLCINSLNNSWSKATGWVKRGIGAGDITLDTSKELLPKIKDAVITQDVRDLEKTLNKLFSRTPNRVKKEISR